jgi:hypothetical protein
MTSSRTLPPPPSPCHYYLFIYLFIFFKRHQWRDPSPSFDDVICGRTQAIQFFMAMRKAYNCSSQ